MFNKKHFWMYFVLLFLLTSITLLSFFVWLGLFGFDESTAFNLGREIVNNWESPMVTDVQVSNGTSCPSGYSAIHSKTWPGTLATCSCPYQDGFGNFFNITEGACTTTQLSTNCTTNLERNEVQFNLWKNSKVICAQKGTTTFKEASGACDTTTHKTCLTGESQVCIPQAESCPINYAAVSSAAEANLSSAQIDTNLHLSFGDKAGNYPIAHFKSSEENFCAFSNEQNLGTGNFLYKFLKSKEQKTCLTDPTYLVVDTIGEEDYFKANNYYTDVLQIPGYPRPSNDNPFKIGAKSSYQWTLSCRSSDDYNLATATSRLNLGDALKISEIIVLTALVVTIFSGILIPCGYFAVYRWDLDENNKMRNLAIFLDQIGKLAILATMLMGVYSVWSHLHWYWDVIDMGCSDTFVKDKVLEEYVTKFHYMVWLYTVALILISIIVIHDLIYLVWLIRFEKKDKTAEKSKAERDVKKAKKAAAKKEKSAKKNKKVKAEEVAQEDIEVNITDVEAGANVNTDNALITQNEEGEENAEKNKDFLDNLKESIDKVQDKIAGIFVSKKDDDHQPIEEGDENK